MGAFESLPEELVTRVLVHLGVRDRARCQAVNKSWRRYLDPRTLPLERCTLVASSRLGPSHPPAEWLCRHQPTAHALRLVVVGPTFDTPSVLAVHNALLSLYPRAALRQLELRMDVGVARSFWPAVRLFSQLRQLRLEAEEGAALAPPAAGAPGQAEAGTLDAGMLSSLVSLEALHVVRWGSVKLRADAGAVGGSTGPLVGAGGALLPRLQRFEVWRAASVELAVPLPSLQRLRLEGVRSVRLGRGNASSGASSWGGERSPPLLPVLTKLDIGNPQDCEVRIEVDFSAMPALAELAMDDVAAFSGAHFASLPALTNLRLVGPTRPAGAALLRQAPASLRSLELAGAGHVGSPSSGGGGGTAGTGQGQAAAGVLGNAAGITQLSCDSADIIPQLRALRALRELELKEVSAAELTGEHIRSLAGLPSLRRLSFLHRRVPGGGDSRRRRMQLLQRALPEGCVVEHP